ncbi:hypothetical protein ABK040_002130 [Willaertia magna]
MKSSSPSSSSQPSGLSSTNQQHVNNNQSTENNENVFYLPTTQQHSIGGNTLEKIPSINQLLAPENQGELYSIIIRKDDIYVHTTIKRQSTINPLPNTNQSNNINNNSTSSFNLNNNKKNIDFIDHIPGVIFIIKQLPKATSLPQSPQMNNNNTTINNNNSTVVDVNNQKKEEAVNAFINQKSLFYFIWIPYSYLCTINEDLVIHQKGNGEIVTPDHYRHRQNNNLLDSNVQINNSRIQQDEYVSAKITNNNTNVNQSFNSYIKSESAYTLCLRTVDISYLKKNIPNMGWSYIVITMKDESAHPPLFFHDGGIIDFINDLNQYITLKRHKKDQNTYYISDVYEPLAKSLNQFDFDVYFEDVYSPKETYWQLLEWGSKITKGAKELKNVLFSGGNSQQQSQKSTTLNENKSVNNNTTTTTGNVALDLQAANERLMKEKKNAPLPIVNEALTTSMYENYLDSSSDIDNITSNSSIVSNQLIEGNKKDNLLDSVVSTSTSGTVNNEERNLESSALSGFEIIDNPPVLPNNNKEIKEEKKQEEKFELTAEDWTKTIIPPLNREQWTNYFDSEGRIKNVIELKRIIFYGGIDNDIRKEVWKFLLCYYSFDSTFEERKQLDEEKKKEYEILKLQWTSISAKQESRFSQFKDRKSRVEKDVIRTDRTHPMMKDDNSEWLKVLNDILITYTFYNFDLSYVQGMSDFASPILEVMQDEVEAFWCFASLMEKKQGNFEVNSVGMESQLMSLCSLIKFLDNDFYNYLHDNEATNLFFCFRWILVLFKREFDFEDIKKLWERMWTEYYGEYFHLFMCYAVLEEHCDEIISRQMRFDDILKLCIELSGNLNLEKVLDDTERAYILYRKKLQLQSNKQLTEQTLLL